MRTALITGAAKRIGKGIAQGLLNEGYKLILHAHSSLKELESWVSSHPQKNQIIDIITANLETSFGQDHLVKKTKECISVLDLLVHNASVFYPKPFVGTDRSHVQEMLEVNLVAPFFMTQGLLGILKQSSSPSVIHILDSMWERPAKEYTHYAISKAGLAILTRGLANELAPHIRVNAVAPGAIIFPDFHDEEARLKTIEEIPQKKLGNVDDIAAAVIFLDRAEYVTGEILNIDGGRSIARL